MLTKLLKYELRSTARLLLPLFGAILIFAVINRFLFPEYMAQTSFLQSIISIIAMIIYVLLMAGMFVMTLVIMIQRFYKNLLGDEGYLMFTLPIHTWKHIISKLLVAMLWVISSCIIAFISILIISKQPVPFNEISMALRSMEQELGINGYLFMFELILTGTLILAAYILLIYGAIALGHTFNKHKVMASFGMFIVLNVICQVLIVVFAYVGEKILNLSQMSASTSSQAQLIFLIGFLYAVLIAGGSFLLTTVVLKKKLNLE